VVGSLTSLSVEQAAKVRANLAKLSPEDRRLAEMQVLCAVDQEPTGHQRAAAEVDY
jgi:hypothetical protein